MDRRRFLRAAGVTGAAVAAPFAVSGSAAAQQQYARQMMFPRVEQFSKDYVGRFILLSDPLQNEPKTDLIRECEFTNWAPENTDVYEALIVDRHQTQEAVTVQNLYMKAGTEYPPGTLFIVGEQAMCPQDYVGVLANRVPDERLPPINNSSRQMVSGTTQSESGGPITGGQPGFGALAALSGIAGTAWHLLRTDD